ncbi:MAG: 16S rRNA (guanine(527)-N(7))-methyltransferase RsmG [Clostridia bacterium]|nr:16S rRNA (guanine(527)-N(7))-methyltransferase RsmG [Clostridia bacterium]
MSGTAATVKKYLDLNGIEYSGEQAEKLAAYTDALLEANKSFNLTSVKTVEEAALLHIADCAAAVRYLRAGTLADVGSGAGLPAFVIAIMRPDIFVTAIDATGKKCDFIDGTARVLGLDNIFALCGRAEELGRKAEMRGRFDTCTARAVAELRILCELCLPLVKKGGLFAAMKGPKGDAEISGAGRALELLGGRVTSADTFELKGGAGLLRSVICIEKSGSTPPRYPRRFAVIKKNPL